MEPIKIEAKNDEIKLDMKDTRILYELDTDARQPLSRIAKKVGLSKEVVNYRIKAMEKQGIIEGYYTALDLSKMGYMFCRILLKFQNVDLKKEKDIIDHIKALPYVRWMYTIDGLWDIVFAVYVKDIKDLEKINDDLVRKYGKFILEKNVSIATTIYHFRHNYLFGTKDFSQFILGEKGDTTLDNIDMKILDILSMNSRIPTTDIATSLKISANAIKYRIKNMVKNNIIIGFRPKVNIKKLGYEHYKVFLTLQNITKEKLDNLIGYLRLEQNVIYVTKAIGLSDLEFEVVLRNRSELYKMMKELRSKFSDMIKHYDAILFTQELLINYLPRDCLKIS